MNTPQQITEAIHAMFSKANFISDLGVTLVSITENVCETSLKVKACHRQQHGYIHAGVIATLADHTAGAACRTGTGSHDVITVEFKINYLRPAVGERLRCVGRLLRAGKSIAVAEAEVYALHNKDEKLVAKLTETCAVI